MNLCWRDASAVLPLFRETAELILCQNRLSDCANFQPGAFLQNLRFLNLENNQIVDFAQINSLGKEMPKLEKLNLSLNKLKEIFISQDSFLKLTDLSLEQNEFRDFRFVDNL